MRLTTDQIQTIISVTKPRFGKNAKVFLFESRVDKKKDERKRIKQIR